MPRIIAIAGGGRDVGKTTLAVDLAQLLPGKSRVVKMGHHSKKPNKNIHYLDVTADIGDILRLWGDCDYLIIESGTIAEGGNTDLFIFLPVPGGPDKPGSDRRRKMADVVRGEPIAESAVGSLAQRLNLDDKTIAAMISRIQQVPNS
jgi:Mrp family chromosome partitioning ATPase